MTGWVHLDFIIIRRETEKAFQVHLEDGRFVWIPKSQIADAEDYAAGDKNGTISISAWWSDKMDAEYPDRD